MQYLKKEDVYKCLQNIGGCDGKDEYARGWDLAIDTAIEEINELKSLDFDDDVSQKQTPYIPEPYKKYAGRCKCGFVFFTKDMNYCGNCGQKLLWPENKEYEREKCVEMSDQWIREWKKVNVCAKLIEKKKAKITSSGSEKYTKIIIQDSQQK